jgi:hypothetical protein
MKVFVPNANSYRRWKKPLRFLNLTKEPLQQKVSLYAKWFHWILNEFIGCNEQGLVKNQWIHWSDEQRLMNCTHIL